RRRARDGQRRNGYHVAECPKTKENTLLVSRTFAALALSLALIGFVGTAMATGKPADDVVALDKSLMTHGGGDWSSVEDVKAVAWKPLPPTMLQDCLPD